MATKASSWSVKRQGTLNRFYTRVAVGDVLAREIGTTHPRSVLDLGAGEGALATAAARRWPHVRITTVDIDPACADGLHESLARAGARYHEHRVLDALNPLLPYQLEEPEFDVAICNPPFYRPSWRREFADILRHADFADACPSTGSATAEILFLAQILRLVRVGGAIALIVPNGLAAGWPAIAFRRAILSRHTLRSVIELPAYSFHDTEAQCFILIIDKGPPAASLPVKLLRLEDDGARSRPIFIDAQAAETRFDYTYHAMAQSCLSATTTLRQLGADVRRGSLSSVERKAADAFVFHTGDFPADFSPVTLDSMLPENIEKRVVIAEKGDILMARVDRQAQEKITFVAAGRAAITDCVYRLRLPPEHRERVFRALSSEEGRAQLKAVMKGVGARLIGKAELLDLPLVITQGAA